MAKFTTLPTRIYQDKSIRRAFLPSASDATVYGVNAGVAEYYKATPAQEFPSTLDHIIAATAG